VLGCAVVLYGGDSALVCPSLPTLKSWFMVLGPPLCCEIASNPLLRLDQIRYILLCLLVCRLNSHPNSNPPQGQFSALFASRLVAYISHGMAWHGIRVCAEGVVAIIFLVPFINLRSGRFSTAVLTKKKTEDLDADLFLL